MVVDATVGAATANSYVTLAEADAYFAGHYSLIKGTTWGSLLEPQKSSAVVRATQLIDTLRVLDTELGSGALPIALVDYRAYDLTLHRLNVGQVLSFPRNIDLVVGTYTGYIPQPVKDATCEQSIYLLSFDEAAMVLHLAGIRHQTVAAGSVRISQDFVGGTGSFMSPLAIELMRPFFRPTKKIRRA